MSEPTREILPNVREFLHAAADAVIRRAMSGEVRTARVRFTGNRHMNDWCWIMADRCNIYLEPGDPSRGTTDGVWAHTNDLIDIAPVAPEFTCARPIATAEEIIAVVIEFLERKFRTADKVDIRLEVDFPYDVKRSEPAFEGDSEAGFAALREWQPFDIPV